jgi:hypothetical protein
VVVVVVLITVAVVAVFLGVGQFHNHLASLVLEVIMKVDIPATEVLLQAAVVLVPPPVPFLVAVVVERVLVLQIIGEYLMELLVQAASPMEAVEVVQVEVFVLLQQEEQAAMVVMAFQVAVAVLLMVLAHLLKQAVTEVQA